MNNNLRQQVLNSFKLLHRTRQRVFNGDFAALQKARKRINEEFRSKKNVTDTSAITELLKYSNEVENELRTTVVQAQEVAPGKYELKITKATVKMDNIPYKHCDSN